MNIGKRLTPYVMAFQVCLLVLVISVNGYAEEPNVLGVSLQLDEAIYTEETVGDIAAAAVLYKNIIKNEANNRTYIAEALLRLAQCQEKLGNSEESKSNFEKISKEYEDIPEIAKLANGFLQKGFLDVNTLLPAPWLDGEVLRYSAYYNTDQMSYYLLEVKSLTGEDDRWLTESNRINPSTSGLNYSQRVVSNQSGEIISSSLRGSHNKGQSIRVFPEKVTFTNLDAGTEYSVNKMPEQSWIQNDEIIRDLLRRLPLSETYATKVKSVHGVIMELKVVASGEIVVPAGEFSAYEVVVRIMLNGDLAEEFTIWVAKDEGRPVVKVQAQENIVNLTHYQAQGSDKPSISLNNNAGVQLQLPATWQSYKKGNDTDKSHHHLFVPLKSYETTAYYFQDKKEYYDWTKVSMDEAVKEIEAWDFSYLKHYSRNKESDVEFMVDGHLAASFTADIRYNIEGWVDYHIMIANEPYVEHYVFQTKKSEFPQRKIIYDQMINSIKFVK